MARSASQYPTEALVQVNLRVRPALAEALAERAIAEGTTQKAIILRALRAVGFDVEDSELEATPVRRRGMKGP